MSLSCLWDYVIKQIGKILNKEIHYKENVPSKYAKILLCLSCSILLFMFSTDCKNLLEMRLYFQVRLIFLYFTVTVLLFNIQSIIA